MHANGLYTAPAEHIVDTEQGLEEVWHLCCIQRLVLWAPSSVSRASSGLVSKSAPRPCRPQAADLPFWPAPSEITACKRTRAGSGPAADHDGGGRVKNPGQVALLMSALTGRVAAGAC